MELYWYFPQVMTNGKWISPWKLIPAQEKVFPRALHPEQSEGCNRDPRGVKTARGYTFV